MRDDAELKILTFITARNKVPGTPIQLGTRRVSGIESLGDSWDTWNSTLRQSQLLFTKHQDLETQIEKYLILMKFQFVLWCTIYTPLQRPAPFFRQDSDTRCSSASTNSSQHGRCSGSLHNRPTTTILSMTKMNDDEDYRYTVITNLTIVATTLKPKRIKRTDISWQTTIINKKHSKKLI